MQHEQITLEGGKPKTRLSPLSAYIVCSLAALMPIKVRIVFIFLINFIYNHILATTRLIFAFLSRQLTHLLIFLTYFLVLGPTSLLVRLCGRDYLREKNDESSLFTNKEPADSSEERFERQF